MASFTPYTYIQCPCYNAGNRRDASEDAQSPTTSQASDGSSEADDRAFDPRAPRSNCSLYPPEYLLFCDDCHEIRCPRCVLEELATVYCPACLFEVGSATLKNEGNRCTRSCFQCPICLGPLNPHNVESAPEPSLLSADNASPTGPSSSWVLTCSYCHWNSSEIGIRFDKSNSIYAQLLKLRYPEEHARTTISGDVASARTTTTTTTTTAATIKNAPESAKARFSAMKAFYSSQNANTTPSASLSGFGDLGIHSPGALSRIMNIYSGAHAGGLKQKNKVATMREAESHSEGLRLANLDDSSAIAQLRRDGWDGTVTTEQARSQPEEGARFTDQLWPIPYLLRSKRAKRCPVCRHIISKPEPKVGHVRYKLRLVANSFIPSISIRPLNPPPSPSATISTAPVSFGPTSASSMPGLLKPLQPAQYLLTFKNPLFDEIKVTLATPATTPGRFASKVTVLCPQFHVDANTDTDMYLEDVLRDTEKNGSGGGGGGSGSGSGSSSRRRPTRDEGNGTHQAEAGKIWERGRNWVSIVVEVVPASLRIGPPPALLRKEGDPEPDLSPLKEDEDVLEIPMFVRLEWEVDVSHDQVGTTVGKEKDVKEKRELAYWCAIGIGRISQD